MVLPPVVLKSLNLVTYIIAVTTIVLSREHIQDALNAHPNFLSNSHLGYAIPALSAFLLGGFTLVQWFDFAYEIVVDGVQWHLFVSNLVVAAWALSWEDGPMSWAALGAAGAIVVLLAIGNYHAEFSKDPDSWSGGAIAL
ncbi:hypothetical protein BGZ98_002380, partial [Dissophora globulifera]